MAVAGLKAVYQCVMRTMMKAKGETGIVQTMPKKDLIELNTQITAQRLMQNGIDPTQLKNADQVENVIKRLESRPATGEVASTPEAKVFDLEGKEIPKGAKIMGGKEVKETDAQIKARLEKGNKEGIARIKTKQKMVEDAIENVSPGLSGDRKIDAELVAEDLATRMGQVYDDLPIKERLKLYDEAYSALTDRKFGKFNLDKLEDIDLDEFAQGGRAGFKIGGIDKARRAFLKTVGAAGAGITALKTGLLGLGKEAAPMVEAAKEKVTKAPDYFFALVEKIKRFGKSVDDPVADPRVERTYKYKNYELRENAFGDPGETIVTKTDDMGEFGYKEEAMRYKKGGPTEDGFVPDEYEEMTVRPDAEGKLKDVEDGIEDISEIIEEATKSAPPIKKAGGGIARMLGE